MPDPLKVSEMLHGCSELVTLAVILPFLHAMQQQVRRLATKVEREKIDVAVLTELTVTILGYTRDHGRVTMGSMVQATRCEPEHAEGAFPDAGGEKAPRSKRRRALDLVFAALNGSISTVQRKTSHTFQGGFGVSSFMRMTLPATFMRKYEVPPERLAGFL